MTASTAPIAVIAPAAPRADHRTTGLLMAVGSALAFSSSGPLIKPLLEAGWSISSALVVRMGLAGLVLLPALIRAVNRDRRFFLHHWKMIAAFGLISVAGCHIFFFAAMQRMPALSPRGSHRSLLTLAWLRQT